MATALKIAGACRFNIVISGGTGSGKTTMLNALSKMIDPGERVLTIEDAAELRLQQPHWLPLETRPPNLEGQGEITIRDLVKNALRMRPDRIILGEIRGAECFDLLAAMNTGHDGSMCTLHSNSPARGLGRMENMVMMGDIKMPKEAISRQIADSVDLIVQVKRLRDGPRRVTNITEVIGMEGPVIVTQELFKFEYLDESADGKIIGEYRSMGLRPYTLDKARAVRLRPGDAGGVPLRLRCSALRQAEHVAVRVGKPGDAGHAVGRGPDAELVLAEAVVDNARHARVLQRRHRGANVGHVPPHDRVRACGVAGNRRDAEQCGAEVQRNPMVVRFVHGKAERVAVEGERAVEVRDEDMADGFRGVRQDHGGMLLGRGGGNATARGRGVPKPPQPAYFTQPRYFARAIRPLGMPLPWRTFAPIVLASLSQPITMPSAKAACSA